jgi:MFS family permease
MIVGISFLFIFFLLKESSRGSVERIRIGSIVSAGKDINLLVFTLLCTLVFAVMGQLSSTLSVYSVSHTGFSTTQYGFLLTLNGLLVVVFQYPFTRILKRVGYSASLISGSLLYGAGYLLMAWVGGYGLAVGAMVIVTTAEIIFAPTTLAVVGEMAVRTWRGRYMAFFGLSETMGMTIGLLIGGLLLDRFPSHPLYVWGIIAGIAFLAAAGFSRFKIEKRVSLNSQTRL